MTPRERVGEKRNSSMGESTGKQVKLPFYRNFGKMQKNGQALLADELILRHDAHGPKCKEYKSNGLSHDEDRTASAN